MKTHKHLENRPIFKLKESVGTLFLKNGEILLVDRVCGKWTKTSISFTSILKYLKKGIPKKTLEERIQNRFKIKANEIYTVLDVLVKNDLLEPMDESNLVRVVDIYKLNRVRLLVNPLVNTNILNSLIAQLREIRGDEQAEIIFDIKKDPVNINQIKEFIGRFDTQDPSLMFLIRIGLNDLINYDMDCLTSYSNVKFQISYDLHLYESENNDRKVLRMQQLIDQGKSIELRYPIVDFFNTNQKKQSIVNFLNLPFSTYYFTWDELANNGWIKDKTRYYRNIAPALDYFTEETRTIVKEGHLNNLYLENTLIAAILFPVKRNSCGAGINNFYIDQHGNITPCKFIQHIKIKDFTRNNCFTDRAECDICIHKNFCGGICTGIQKDPLFGKLCKIQKKNLKKCFSMLRVNLLKQVEKIAQDQIEEQKDPINIWDIQMMEQQLIRRQTCSIGLY